LCSLKQRKGETALDYIKRWRDFSMRCDNPPTQEDVITICRRGLAAEISEKLLSTNIKGFDQLNSVVAEIEMFFADNPVHAPSRNKPNKERAFGKEVNVVDFTPKSQGKKVVVFGAPSKKAEGRSPSTSLPELAEDDLEDCHVFKDKVEAWINQGVIDLGNDRVDPPQPHIREWANHSADVVTNSVNVIHPPEVYTAAGFTFPEPEMVQASSSSGAPTLWPLKSMNKGGSSCRRGLQSTLKARQKKFRDNLLDERKGLDDIKSRLLMSKLQEWRSPPQPCSPPRLRLRRVRFAEGRLERAMVHISAIRNTAHFVEEMMELSPPATIPPPAASAAGAEIASHDATIISSALGSGKSLPSILNLTRSGSFDILAEEGSHLPETSSLDVAVGEAVGEVPAAEGDKGIPSSPAIGSGSFPPSSSKAPFEGPGTFPEHDILWLDAPQGGQMPGAGGMLDFFVTSTRAIMEESRPPSVEAVRGILQRSTLAYHLMGCPRDPWMAAVDSLWGEVRQLHQKAASRLRIQELRGKISQLEEKAVAKLRQTADEIQRRIATYEISIAAFDRGVSKAEAEMATLEQDCSGVQCELADCEAALASLEGGGIGLAYRFGVCWLKGFDLTDHGSLLVKEGDSQPSCGLLAKVGFRAGGGRAAAVSPPPEEASIMPFKKNYLARDNHSQKTRDGVVPKGIMMPALARPRITEANLPSLDSGYHVVATLNPEGLPPNGSFIPPNMLENDPCILAERRYLEFAILRFRDSLLGTCAFSYPSFPLGYMPLKRMPTADNLGPYNHDLDCYTRSRKLSPVIWNLQNRHTTAMEINGTYLMPGDSRYAAGKWLTGVLHHYGEILKKSGIYGAVEAALYDYPCYTGVLRGLPISGLLYEEIVLDDLHSHRSNGSGQYFYPYSLRFLTKDIMKRVGEACSTTFLQLVPKPLSESAPTPSLRINGDRGNGTRPGAPSSSTNRRAEKAKEMMKLMRRAPAHPFQMSVVLRPKVPLFFIERETGALYRAMADPLPEEGTDGAPSHFTFSGVVEADVDCPGFTYAELGASEGEYSSAPVELNPPFKWAIPQVEAEVFTRQILPMFLQPSHMMGNSFMQLRHIFPAPFKIRILDHPISLNLQNLRLRRKAQFPPQTLCRILTKAALRPWRLVLLLSMVYDGLRGRNQPRILLMMAAGK
ncbi:hypothetical protein Taro_022468, partial [Colocasia esculenta]|nr:hypothetical protein [Colocasia esculenta]